jgi:hypothetical protein
MTYIENLRYLYVKKLVNAKWKMIVTFCFLEITTEIQASHCVFFYSEHANIHKLIPMI